MTERGALNDREGTFNDKSGDEIWLLGMSAGFFVKGVL